MLIFLPEEKTCIEDMFWIVFHGIVCYVADLLSDDESPRRAGPADMSIFRNAVKDCLDYDHIRTEKNAKTNRSKASNDISIEKFSGLRMRYCVVICVTELCILCY